MGTTTLLNDTENYNTEQTLQELNDKILKLSAEKKILASSLKTLADSNRILAETNADLIVKLNTEMYIKNAIGDFISSKGLSNEYYEEFRYFYANENLKEFSRTTMFPGYMEKLAENGNITEIERIKGELV